MPVSSYPILGALCFGAGLLALIFIRKRDFTLSVYALLSWNVLAAGLVAGFLRAQVDPCASIPSKVICSQDLPNGSAHKQEPALS